MNKYINKISVFYFKEKDKEGKVIVIEKLYVAKNLGVINLPVGVMVS